MGQCRVEVVFATVRAVVLWCSKGRFSRVGSECFPGRVVAVAAVDRGASASRVGKRCEPSGILAQANEKQKVYGVKAFAGLCRHTPKCKLYKILIRYFFIKPRGSVLPFV